MKTKWQKINSDSGNKTYLTPRSILDNLGHFDTDPCCPENMPWETADMMLTEKDDGTAAEWHGRVWLNPPYGNDARPFMERMSKHSGGGIALIFARTDTKIWHELIFPFAHSIFFFAGRILFCGIDGKDRMPNERATAPSALVSYSEFDTDIVAGSGLKGTLLRLQMTGK